MHHHVCAQIKWILQERSCERVVHGQQDFILFRDCSNSTNINNIDQGIGGCFCPDQFCILIDQWHDIVCVLHVHKVKFQTEFFKNLREQTIGSAIHVVCCDHFITGFQQF